MMHLIFFLEAAQNRDGIFDSGLPYQDLLETSLQSGILFDIFSILVQCRGADAVQFSAGKRGFEHIPCIHGALCLACAHHGVQFIDEENDLAFLFTEISQHGLEPLFKLTPEFGASDERAQIERKQALAAYPLRHFPVYNSLCQSLCDRRLTHPGFTDQYRIVFGPPLQNLNRAANFLISPNHGVKPALLGAFGQVDRVFLQRLALFFSIGVIHRFSAAHRFNGFFYSARDNTGPLHRVSQLATIFKRRQNKQLARNELITPLLCKFVGEIERPAKICRDLDVTAGSFYAGESIQHLAQAGAQRIGIGACAGQ